MYISWGKLQLLLHIHTLVQRNWSGKIKVVGFELSSFAIDIEGLQELN